VTGATPGTAPTTGRGSTGPAPVAPLPGALARVVPIVGWAPRYPRERLRGDVIAGLTVAVMLVPQGMAYAGLAGMPPIAGLYAAMVGIVAYAIFGSSGSLAVGPVAITSLLTASGLAGIVEADDPAYLGAAALLAVLVGALLIGLGVARLGALVSLLSHPVISGFTSGAAVVIALSQVKDLAGLDIGRPETTVGTARALLDGAGATHLPTLAIGLAAAAALLAGRRLARRFPTPLVVVGLATAGVWATGADTRGVAVLGEVPSGLPTPALPTISGSLVGQLLPVAVTIAVVAYAEGISIATAIARKTRDRIEPDQELVATGAANVAAGAFGGFPIAGGFSRTAVNFQAGARTPLASLVTAGVLAVAVLWFTPLFTYLPRSVLAAVVVVAVLGLVDLRDAVATWRARPIDGVTLVVTFAATLLIGIELGLAIGVGFSLAVFVHRSANPHTAELGRVEGCTELRNVARWPTRTAPTAAVLRMDGPLFFAATRRLADRVGVLAARPGLQAIVLDASAITDVDSSGAHALAELDADLATAGIDLHLAVIRGPVRDVLRRCGVWERLEPRIHASLTEAVHVVDPTGALWTPGPDEMAPARVV
jgi:sulfate permease, SulP family